MISRVVVIVTLFAVVASACSVGGSSSAAHHLEVSEPEIGPGERVYIRIVDLGLDVSQVEVTAMLERDDIQYESKAVFEVMADGVVDLDLQMPLAGTYDTADSAGLIWSLAATGNPASDPPAMISTEDLAEITIEISASIDDNAIDQQALTVDPAPGVEIVDAVTNTAEGFAAVLLANPSRCPCPTIIVFGGSQGGMSPQPGAALASEGYAVAVVAYFGLDGLPSTLAGIDPNLITPALDWVVEHETATLPAAVLGLSRGSELAVEAALRDDRIAALVLGAPSSARWVGFGAPAWIDNGDPLPFLLPTGSPGLHNGATATRPVFETALEQADPTTDPAFLAVENVTGPMLLISGADDQVWPAEQMAAQIVEKRCRPGRATSETINIIHPGAGHWFGLPPPSPTLGPTYQVGTTAYASGGTPAANASASEATWQSMLGYLGHHLNEVDDLRYPNPSC